MWMPGERFGCVRLSSCANNDVPRVVSSLALRALVENMPKKSRAELVSIGVCGALVQFLDANISHPKAGEVTHIITAPANLF